ncbi:hypothetical protein EFK07_11585 [Pseudomonas putida]|uniref:Uncharacterized protein n=1 Tax=Pseudomonas putida TaxID=303 RepID=A0A3M8T7N4_PSEPU|nr:hypothetical protein EFK07_11585 [Pseudomonas putida]
MPTLLEQARCAVAEQAGQTGEVACGVEPVAGLKSQPHGLARTSVGAALCCEEARTDYAYLLLVPASSQHKAAPTGGGRAVPGGCS